MTEPNGISNLQKAFFDQQKFTDEEADARDKTIEEYSMSNVYRAWEEKSKTPSASKAINAPTQNPQLDDTPEVHPQMKGYDHSLEQNRWKQIGGKSVEFDDEVEIETFGGETQSYQK